MAHRKTSPSGTAATTAPPLAQSILELVGATPMLRLNRYAPAGGAGIYAKLEFLNPGGSVKDRAALGMVDAAEAGSQWIHLGVFADNSPARRLYESLGFGMSGDPGPDMLLTG